MAHKLFLDLIGAGTPDEDMKELYEDLRDIFDGPFDKLINDAVSNRGCVYMELRQALPN